ncbi:MAG: SDR family oxidoreductase [Myxococcota bacterium]|nr:SDR family oxidoreductase [Myxococcota bacterium]
MSQRCILLTGSTSGIGRALAAARLRAGDTVIGVGRNHAKARLDHANYIPVTLDLADPAAVLRRMTHVFKDWPQIDVVVSNAGYGSFEPLENYSLAQIESFFQVNLLAHVVVARLAVPHLKSRGGGRLIFMGSESALKGAQKGSLYCTAKFAVRGLAQSLRAECARRGVGVTIVNPGMVQTPFFDELKFSPGQGPGESLDVDTVAAALGHVIDAAAMTVIDEINLSPMKRVITFD